MHDLGRTKIYALVSLCIQGQYNRSVHFHLVVHSIAIFVLLTQKISFSKVEHDASHEPKGILPCAVCGWHVGEQARPTKKKRPLQVMKGQQLHTSWKQLERSRCRHSNPRRQC